SLDADLSVRLLETGGQVRFRAEGGIQAQGLPLAAVGPFLHRFDSDARLDGRLSADLALHPGDDQPGQPDVRVEGGLLVEDFSLGDPWLGPDQLLLPRVDMPCRVAL